MGNVATSQLIPGMEVAWARGVFYAVVQVVSVPRSGGKREVVVTDGLEHHSRVVAGAQRWIVR